MNKEEILEKIRQRQVEFNEFGIKKIGLFGSYARGEQLPNSDIDILIDFKPEEEKFDNLMAVYDLLENLFPNKKIELITRNGLSPYIGPKILKEVEYV